MTKEIELTPEQKAEQEAILKEKIERANEDANRIIKVIEEKGDDDMNRIRWTQLFLQSLCGYVENGFMQKRFELKVSDLGLITNKIEKESEREITEYTLDRLKEYNVYDAVLLLDKMNKIIENKLIVEQIKRPITELQLNFTPDEQDKDSNSKFNSEEPI